MRTIAYPLTCASAVVLISVQLDQGGRSKRSVTINSRTQNGPAAINYSIPNDVLTGQALFDLSYQHFHSVILSRKFDNEGWTLIANIRWY